MIKEYKELNSKLVNIKEDDLISKAETISNFFFVNRYFKKLVFRWINRALGYFESSYETKRILQRR